MICLLYTSREWLELLDECKYAQLKEEINEENAANLAEFFEEVPEEKRLLVFRLLTKDNAAETFSYMDSDMQEDILNSVTDNEVQTIINELSVDAVSYTHLDVYKRQAYTFGRYCGRRERCYTGLFV